MGIHDISGNGDLLGFVFADLSVSLGTATVRWPHASPQTPTVLPKPADARLVRPAAIGDDGTVTGSVLYEGDRRWSVYAWLPDGTYKTVKLPVEPDDQLDRPDSRVAEGIAGDWRAPEPG